MTTIAFDGKVLASDSQSTSGSMIVSLNAVKIHSGDGMKINGKPILYYAVSGSSAADTELRDVLLNDLDFMTDFSEGVSFTALAIIGDGECYIIYKDAENKRAEIAFHRGKYSIGSGREFAMAAMHMGKSAAEAIHVAMELDIYSGGHVEWVSC